MQTLNIILRADVRGSIEAIRKELGKLQHPEVQIKILQATVGGITEADVHLADASDAVIIGFNVVADEAARTLAEQRGVQIRRYDIIYQVTEDLRAALEGMLRPEKQEKEMGRALVQRTFHISRVGTVAGCRVLAGTITARRAHAPDPRKPRHRRLRAGIAAARKGRRPRSPRRHGMRHQAGRLQRPQGRRRPGSLQDRGDPADLCREFMMSLRRVQKAAEAIREVVSMAILAELKDPRVRDVTVTYVEVSADLRHAKVHVSVMGDETRQQLSLRGLQNAAGFLQAKIADRIDIRYTPRLSFLLDQGVKRSIAVAQILREVLPPEKPAESAAECRGNGRREPASRRPASRPRTVLRPTPISIPIPNRSDWTSAPNVQE